MIKTETTNERKGKATAFNVARKDRPMIACSATDSAIYSAIRCGTLTVTDHFNRFGDAYCAINDERGMIEVHYSRDAVKKRLAEIKDS